MAAAGTQSFAQDSSAWLQHSALRKSTSADMVWKLAV
jgi:hypothetical protein